MLWNTKHLSNKFEDAEFYQYNSKELKTFDVPFDRWSESLRYKAGAVDFIPWVNNIAIPKIESGIKRGQKKFCFSSENEFFTCEADDRDSGGYLYCGFYSTEKYDEMIKERII